MDETILIMCFNKVEDLENNFVLVTAVNEITNDKASSL